MRNSEQIIVKRQQRRNSQPKGGGAWKVAFADFTLAMMSLFLVLWLLAVTNQEERVLVANRLRDYSILDNEANPFDISNSPYPVDLGGTPSVLEEIAPEYILDGQPRPRFHEAPGTQGYGSLTHGRYDDPKKMALLAGVIKHLGEDMQAKDNLQLQIVPQGLRILIRDDDQREMYARGSSQITPFFHHLLMALAPVFQRVENPVVISGHTDSTPFSGTTYSNWELSSERAMTARRVLVAGGMPTGRVAQVVGMADTMLEDKQHPRASVNRRIELLILADKGQADLEALFDPSRSGGVLQQATQRAKQRS